MIKHEWLFRQIAEHAKTNEPIALSYLRTNYSQTLDALLALDLVTVIPYPESYRPTPTYIVVPTIDSELLAVVQ